MGIAPYKTFTFDGESSADYGVYITGEGVFNAPERAVEMVDIPGRNGSYALDQGRFGNIEVTYTAGMVDDSETDFADRLADVRNWLCSKKGYVRLEDDYNPDEYRMAVYSSGISVEHADLRTGEFEISFDCKPQRWLTSGETATAVANNGTLTNPTRFDAEPLLEVKGYGGIEFNGYEIDVENVVLGRIDIADGYNFEQGATFNFDPDLLNPGDVISVSGTLNIRFNTNAYHNHTSTDSDADFSTTNGNNFVITTFSTSLVFGTDTTKGNHLVYTGQTPHGAGTLTMTVDQTITLDAVNGELSITVSPTASTTGDARFELVIQYGDISAYGNSTVSALGNPTYIDCEIGEAYMYKGGNIVSCNQAVALGSDLPKLASGTNTITFDNTVTELKIHPRWWRV